MNKKELIQKYIDKELPDADRKAVEFMIEQDSYVKVLLEDLLAKRKEVFKALAQLNPDKIPAPDFTFQSKRKRKLYQNWKLVAGLLVIFGVTSLLWSILNSNDKSDKEKNLTEVANTEITCSEIDYYISPNRCWNQRQLVVNFQIIK